mgnify:CR=1 FL=1
MPRDLGVSSGFHRLGANADPAKAMRRAEAIVNHYRAMEPLPELAEVLPLANVPGGQLSFEPGTIAGDPVPASIAATLLGPNEHEPGALVRTETRGEAKAKGYTGDQCDNCNSMRMKISGHCTVCEDCGTTTGCS